MSISLVFNFEKSANIEDWVIVNDVVMGGRSTADFGLDENGNGVFNGEVSLENNGGFASLRYRFESMNVEDFKNIQLKVKGDGKRYQFRIKASAYDRHSYICYFDTNKEWQNITIPINELFPSFRGYQLDMPNFDKAEIEEIAFLIGNKKAEKFELILDSISLK
jgi:hypothetical protein